MSRAALARALSRLGADDRVDDVTVIGDRRYDIEAGRAHNTRTIGVTWGFGSRDELEQAGADRVVDHPGEIADIVAPLANG
ncbi:MAG: HAD hydrolase-like protein [Acidimicrobiia bacterium]